MSAVLATVGVPPRIATAPPFTKILPAASRLRTMVLSWPSPNTERTWLVGENVATTAGMTRSARGSTLGRNRQGLTGVGRRRRAVVFQSLRNMFDVLRGGAARRPGKGQRAARAGARA